MLIYGLHRRYKMQIFLNQSYRQKRFNPVFYTLNNCAVYFLMHSLFSSKNMFFNTSLLQAVTIIQLILTLCITCVSETSFMRRTCGTPLSDRFNKEACFLLCCSFPRNDEKRQKWIQATYYVPRIPFVSMVFLNL